MRLCLLVLIASWFAAAWLHAFVSVGHVCFGAVLYPITMADFTIADVTDGMMDGEWVSFTLQGFLCLAPRTSCPEPV